VHEAFGEPTEPRPLASPTIPKAPPNPVQELPPEERPEGDEVVWIPGYWAFDDDADDFVWVSGFWREPPPGRTWVPGEWHEVEGGWQWSSGFWADQAQETLEYLPPPPPSVEAGPSVPAPRENMTYVPGCWIYRQTRYWWRPGFWVESQPG